jgi:hypothetical protein
MRPSSRFFFDPEVIYENDRARQRALWLYRDVGKDVRSSPELQRCQAQAESAQGRLDALTGMEQKEGPFPSPWRKLRRKDQADVRRWERDERLRRVAEVADSYSRLLTWLAEGQASGYWNVFGTWIAILRCIPGVRRLVWRYFFKPIADHAPWRLALYEVILQAVRSELNEKCLDQSGLRLAMNNSAQGLSAVTDIAMMTETAARRQLRAKIEKMSSGCIGVTGLRGAGKSTLIRDFCGHRYGTPPWAREGQTELPGLRLKVQAPCRYDAREFLVHLYTCLCRTVLADVRLNPTSFFDLIVLPLFLPRSVRPTTLARGLAAIGFLAVAGDLAFHAVAGHWWLPSWTSPTSEWVGVAVASFAALVVTGWRTRQSLLEVRGVLTLATDAQARLEKLHFQRTENRSYTGTLGGPMRTGVNVSGGQSLTEQMMTMPELVDDYCDFVERVVAALEQVISAKRGGHRRSRKGKRHQSEPGPRDVEVRLVIGIDEMDQIGDIRAAGLFLAELQSVFGTSNCVYLISTSPRALADADKLEVPVRKSASAIFDEMVWVEPLDLPTVRKLLNQRVIGLLDGYIELSYVLSGGLPKDLLRIARTTSAIGSGTSAAAPDLAAAVAAAITDELDQLAHRAMADAVSLEIPAAPELLKLLSGNLRQISQSKISGFTIQPGDIRELMNALTELWAEQKRQRFADNIGDAKGEISSRTAEICDGFLAGLYFLLTVQQLFTAKPELATPEVRDDTCMLYDDGTLKGLAWARAALDINPYLAAAIISDTYKGGKVLTEPAFLTPSPVDAKAKVPCEDPRGRVDVSHPGGQAGDHKSLR